MPSDKRRKNIEREVAEALGKPVETSAEPVVKRFTPEQEASERAVIRAGLNQPGFKHLAAHMERFGPDGVLESAIHLPEEQYARLEKKAKSMKFNKKDRKWETP